MPSQYVIEHQTENNRFLHKILRDKGSAGGQQTNCYRPDITAALVFKKAEAIAFAKKWGGRVWQIRNGQAETQVWPEGNG